MKTEIVDVDEIHDAIIAYAQGDFSKRLAISCKHDIRDSIVSGINMLGEELEEKTISKNYFSSIYDAVSDILIVLDHNGVVKDSNKALNIITGICEEELKGQNIDRLIIDSEKPFFEFIKEDLVNEEYYPLNSFIKNKSGRITPVSGSLSKMFDHQRNQIGYLITCRDISETLSKEQERIRTIEATQEKERNRMAKDLHDSLGQELSAIRLMLNSLDTNKSEFRSRLEQCKTMLDQSINSIRHLSFNLMPKSLEYGDLISAIREFNNRLRNQINIELQTNLDKIELDTNSQIMIYRVLQEFVSNTLKHAEATKILIEVRTEASNIRFTFSDNGKGFYISNDPVGTGLSNIKTRLKAIGTKGFFNSQIGNGTTLKFTLADGNY